MRNSMMRVYDPLYGVIELSPLEYSIISSPEIQRLRYVRMCNINSLLVTGASEISRFEHIIGVLFLTKAWIEHNGSKLPNEKKEELIAAALLHDVQTGPFGHSLQYVFEDNDSDDSFIHDDITHGTYQKFHQLTDANTSFAGRTFESEEILGNKWEGVASLIRGETSLGPLISGTVDLDNIDNVIRLAYHVGVAETKDSEVATELAKDLLPSERGLEVSSDKIHLLERWQEIRSRLYELLLLDWAEFSAKAMLTRAMELAVEHNLLGADSWLRTDLELLNYLENSKGDTQEISHLTKRIKCGRLYSPICLVKSNDTKPYKKFSNIVTKRNLENSLIKKIHDEINTKINLIIHPILDKRKTDRSVDVVVKSTGEKVKVGKDSNQLLIGVFTSIEVESPDKQKKIERITIEFLENEGLGKVDYIQDPMGKFNKTQMELL